VASLITSAQIGYNSWRMSCNLPSPSTLSVPLLLIDERLSSSAAAAALASAATAKYSTFDRPPRTHSKRTTTSHKNTHQRPSSAVNADGDGVDAASAAWILEAAIMGIIGRKGLITSPDS
jgi:hypothetical protein